MRRWGTRAPREEGLRRAPCPCDDGTEQRPKGLVLFSLCVDDRYRRQRVGARLIERVLEQGRRACLPVFLLVAQGCGATGECMLAFQERVPRLRETYTRLGWQEQCECEEYILYIPGRRKILYFCSVLIP